MVSATEAKPKYQVQEQTEGFWPDRMPSIQFIGGLTIDQAIEYAREIGCVIVYADDRAHLEITHPCMSKKEPCAVQSIKQRLINLPGQMSKSLRGYLVQVNERVSECIKQKKNQDALRRKHEAKRAGLVGGLDSAPAVVEEAGQTGEVKPAEGEPGSSFEDAIEFVCELVSAIHYRDHINMDGGFRGVGTCDSDLCVRGRRHLESLRKMHGEWRAADELFREMPGKSESRSYELGPATALDSVGEQALCERFCAKLLELAGDHIGSRGNGWPNSVRTCLRYIMRGDANDDALRGLVRRAMLGEIWWAQIESDLCRVKGRGLKKAWVGPMKWPVIEPFMRQTTEALIGRSLV